MHHTHLDHLTADSSPQSHCDDQPSPTPTVTPAPQEKRQKRKQAKKACFECNRTSRKCENQRPCPRCIHRNVECFDVPRKKRSKKKPKFLSGNETNGLSDSTDSVAVQTVEMTPPSPPPVDQLPYPFPNTKTNLYLTAPIILPHPTRSFRYSHEAPLPARFLSLSEEPSLTAPSSISLTHHSGGRSTVSLPGIDSLLSLPSSEARPSTARDAMKISRLLNQD